MFQTLFLALGHSSKRNRKTFLLLQSFYSFFFFLNIYSFRLLWVLVVARGIFVAACGIF